MKRQRETKRRFKLLAKMRAYFLAGLLVTAPIFITATVAWWLIEFVDNQIVPLVPAKYNPDTYMKEVLGVEIGLPGLGILILVVFITLVGALTAGLVGRWIIRLWEMILNKMPFIRTVYNGSKQILETALKSQSSAFRQAVLVEYPRKGLWAVAFLTSDTSGEVGDAFDDAHINVFLPTTPNPTSGFLLFVPKKDVVFLDMPVEDAVKMVISAGIVTPEQTGRKPGPRQRPGEDDPLSEDQVIEIASGGPRTL